MAILHALCTLCAAEQLIHTNLANGGVCDVCGGELKATGRPLGFSTRQPLDDEYLHYDRIAKEEAKADLDAGRKELVKISDLRHASYKKRPDPKILEKVASTPMGVHG